MPKTFLEKIPNKYEILYGFMRSTINGVILVDALGDELKILYANEAFCNITGYDIGEITGLKACILRGPKTDPYITASVMEGISAHRELDIETTYYTKDGTPFLCNLIATPIFDEKEQIKYYLMIFRNISYKEEIRTLRDVLSEEFMLSMEYKDAIDEGSIVSKTDIHGIITHVNDAFCNISGYERMELLGSPHNIVRHPDMPKEAFEDMWRTILDKRVWKGSLKNRKKDGEAYFVDATIKPILNTKGEIIEFISIRHDITEQILAKEAAQKALEAKSAFFAKASHELRTPLNAVINFTEMVKEEMELGCDDSEIREQNRDYLNRIEKNSRHLLSLINDLLDISKVDKKGLELSRMDITSIVSDAISSVRPAAAKKGVEIIHDIPKTPLFAEANGRAFLQVMLNLLSNAIKFTDSGSIVVWCEEESGKTLLKVKDSGRGIPKEKAGKIFEAFEQSREGDEGTGLGLKLVKDMCRAMKMEVSLLFSEEGKGSIFQITINRSLA